MTAKERWYKLHRARREMRRHERHMMPQCLQILADTEVPRHIRMRIAERMLNPVIVFDPELPRA